MTIDDLKKMSVNDMRDAANKLTDEELDALREEAVSMYPVEIKTYQQYRDEHKDPKYAGGKDKCFVGGCDKVAEFEGGDAVMQCAMAHPMIMREVVKVHPFGYYDLLTKEQFAEMVDGILQRKYNFNKGAVERFMCLVDSGYCHGRTPDEVADGIMYEAEYGDEGT